MLPPLGVGAIQLRVKGLGAREARTMTAHAVALAERHRSRLFINDYWRAAVECGAYGVHLGQEDLDEADLDAIHAAGLRLGISTHSEREWRRAWRLGPSYIALGAVFPTTTKPAVVIGVAQLTQWVALLRRHFPLVAIGGITPHNLEQVLAAGVDSVAVASAITQAPRYPDVVAVFKQRLAAVAESR